MITDNDIKRLTEQAKDAPSLEIFISSVGWEDWMQDELDDPDSPDGYNLTMKEVRRIDEILDGIYTKAKR